MRQPRHPAGIGLSQWSERLGHFNPGGQARPRKARAMIAHIPPGRKFTRQHSLRERQTTQQRHSLFCGQSKELVLGLDIKKVIGDLHKIDDILPDQPHRRLH